MDLKKGNPTIGFAGILVANLIAALDAVALSVSLPTIASALSTTSIEAYWAATSFVLASAVVQPLFPSFSTAFGRRPTLLFTLIVFVIGTIVCGAAQNAATLIAGRTVQGIGCGGILAMLYVVMTDLFDLKQRASVMSINGLVWLLGSAVGPIMGGGFSSGATWRWIFWICLPIAGIALVLVGGFLTIPHHKAAAEQGPGTHHHAVFQAISWRQLDWMGAALLIASLTSFLIPITWGGINYAWDSWHTLTPLVLGIVGCGAWLAYEFSVPTHPILPLSIFKNRTTCCAFLGTFALGIIQFGMIFYLPLYYQVIKGYSAVVSGVALLPETLVSGPMTAITGIIVGKTGKYKPIILVGWAVLALGCGLLVDLHVDSSVAQWIFLNVPAGLGLGCLFATLSIASQAPVRKEDMAVTATLSPFIRSIGNAVGIAVGNGIVQNVLKKHLKAASSSSLRENAELITINLASPDLIRHFTDQGDIQRQELLEAYTKGLRAFWWFLFGLAVFAGLMALPMREVSLVRKAEPADTSTTSSSMDAEEKGVDGEDKEGTSVSVETNAERTADASV